MTTCPSMLPIEVNGHLTPRETQMAKLVSTGLHNKAIAVKLNLSPGTVKTYLTQIFKKLKIGQDGNHRVLLARLVWEKAPDPSCENCSYVGFSRAVQAAASQVIARGTLEQR